MSINKKTIKKFKRSIQKALVKFIPIIFGIAAAIVISSFSKAIPFINELGKVLQPVATTALAILVGLVVWGIVFSLDSFFKTKRFNKGLQAKMMRGERIINTAASPEELRREIKKAQARINEEQRRIDAGNQALKKYRNVSKHEDEVETVTFK